MLEPNDILFVDSTHIAKTYGDVNSLFFDILPVLASGVFVHFHDIWHPFEYPKEAVYNGVVWNEIYILRAFLQYNDTFRIVAFNTFLEQFFPERFQKSMPMCLENKGGQYMDSEAVSATDGLLANRSDRRGRAKGQRSDLRLPAFLTIRLMLE